MNINSQNTVISVNASMKIFKAQAIPGNLMLLSDRICFQASGLLKGTEVKDTFSFEEIKKIKVGFSIAPFRIVIILNDGDNWIFDQVNRKDAKKFAELYETINSN
ncbi:hypothetical protein AABD42_14400 [Staphylococcus shinii]|uniref:hypothetical protein n=1 Tax=Staphylococcus shinii TaxID=2912228 RepID=UPI00398AFF16